MTSMHQRGMRQHAAIAARLLAWRLQLLLHRGSPL